MTTMGKEAISGPAVHLPVRVVMQAMLFGRIDPAEQELPALIDIELEPDFVAEAWRVRWPEAHGAVIGKMVGESTETHALLMGVVEADSVPAAQAYVDFDHVTETFTLEVLLPAPAPVAPAPVSPAPTAPRSNEKTQTYQYSDGTLAVTVPLEAGIDASDQFTPKPGARRVASLR